MHELAFTSIKKIALGRVLACLKERKFSWVCRLSEVVSEKRVFQVQKLCSVLLRLGGGGSLQTGRMPSLTARPQVSTQRLKSVQMGQNCTSFSVFKTHFLFLLNATHFEINILASHHATALQISDYVTQRMSFSSCDMVCVCTQQPILYYTIVLNWVEHVNNHI